VQISFEECFKTYFTQLCAFAMKFTGNLDDAKDLVHEVFIRTWEKYDSFSEDTNIRSYLYTAVNNKGLNFIRDRKKLIGGEDVQELPSSEVTSDMEIEELQRSIHVAINALPERCREVFMLSRFEALKYSEIAKKMGISIKTVEVQMSKALRNLREHLSEFLALVFIFLTR